MGSVFAKNFRFLREERDISQTDMGSRLGLTRASVDAYEDGRAMPPYPKLKKIADHFNLSIERITEDKLWNSPLEKEIERLKQESFERDYEEEPIKREEGSDATFEEQLTSLNIKLEDRPESLLPVFPLVERRHFVNYLNDTWSELKFELKQLSFHLPPDEEYRAFEAGEDFPMKDSVLVGALIKDFNTIKNGQRYIVVAARHGILYRTVFNQVKRKGSLILSGETGDISTSEISISDVKEIWEVKAFMSYSLPEPVQDLSVAMDLAKQLKREIKRLKRDNLR